MNGTIASVIDRAAQLRREFDRTFAEPVHIQVAPEEDLIRIRVGGQACAIRLAEIAGLHVGKEITRLPASVSALLGIAGFRGALRPVYDLQVLLGQARADVPRWLVIAAQAPIALAFAAFEGRMRVPHDAISESAVQSRTGPFSRQLVRTPRFVGPLLHLPSVIEALEKVNKTHRKEE
jgi:chemotaxis signal transduction protein